MLEYFKTILQKVSFDPFLFEKELRKSVKQLLLEELQDLKDWCYAHFGAKHRKILERVFA